MIKRLLYSLIAFVISCTFIKCQSEKKGPSDASFSENSFETSPVVPAEESIAKMKIEEGFEVKLIAAEPLTSSPIALTFDNKGRMWVVEMQGYMPNADGLGEEASNGKVVILEDENQDGVADKRTVFLDSLVLPRSICLIENGILVVETPKLWYYEINNDKPGKKILIDSAYTEGHNLEGQANGLYRAMDNWIYNPNSDKRYRKKGKEWLTERTHFRGQWGISQDDDGRLFYNNNSQNLIGDFFTAGLGAANINQPRVAGYSENIVADNRVYPIRPTPGVNRGYMKDVLDDSLRLINMTAASGPVIYRGDLFDKAYYLNAFVAEPAANLIKRNILEENDNSITGRQAYSGKEFLASLDERFRPVSLYNGPDGALYVVDMYRGIIQHKSMITQYLEKEIQKRNLGEHVNCGRIYKIVPVNKNPKPVLMPDDPIQLVKLLQHPNGWVRDKAQEMLVDGKYPATIVRLKEYLNKPSEPIPLIHALWTLEGMNALQPEEVLPLLKNPDWKIRRQALSVLSSAITPATYKQFASVFQQMIDENDTLAAPYIAFQMQAIQHFDKPMAKQFLLTLAKKYTANVYVSDAIISNLQNKEADFYSELKKMNFSDSLIIVKHLKKVMDEMTNYRSNQDKIEMQKRYPRGVKLFNTVCQSCHKADGNGIPSMAPPLNGSEWVVGDKNKLLSILLFGLTGPVEVNGKVYKAPEISGDMPGLESNGDIVDEDIAQVLNFIRNSWSNSKNKTEPISSTDVHIIRKKFAGRKTPFTIEELNRIK